ncbi:MAG: AMP-binding protein [Acidobacteriia bacterium]|nr:AMP-binding protein [Methyloceanibacter sp.]MBX5471179.1 AMP-binding protein [Acetobacteraceae bacterium]MCL6491907.1 AMP-binding protein [Terriglobia bacterium]
MIALLKTTRPIRPVRTIEDIVAIESYPYDALVTAHNIYDLFRATAQHVGEQKALTVLTAGDPPPIGLSLTHRELLAEVTRAANMFHALGLEPGRGSAAFLVPTLPMMPPLLFGAQVAGIAGSLNYLLSRDAIFDLLNAQRAEILVIPAPEFDEMCWAKAQGVFDHVPTLRHVIVIGGTTSSRFLGLEDALCGCSAEVLTFTPSADRNAVCALFHTGGTTGRPKLAQLTHGNHIHAAFGFAQVFGYDEQDVVIDGFPFFHVGGTMTTGLSVLAAGGHVIVPSPYALRSPAVIEGYWRIVERFRATVVSGVPTSIAALTNAWKNDTDVSSVRMAVTGGAVLPRAVGQRFEGTTGIRLFETYGMTETAAAIAFNPGRGTPLPGSVGFRAPYSEIRIMRLDPNNPGFCGPNESGMVEVRGPQVFPGYMDPTQNQGVFTADGWLITGDIGWLTEDQRLVLTGREKDLIVRSGHNIDPTAIEDVANQFDGVQISAAVGMPDQYAGEVPVLFVVPAPGARLDTEELKAYLDENVHEPPARPRSILVIDALPVTAVGKIFKPTLRDMAVKEKVRLEVARLCGPEASADVEVRQDERKQTVVEVRVKGASAEAVAALAEALRPLPQTYRVRSVAAGTPDELVTLRAQEGIAVITLNRPDRMNALSRAMMRALQAKLTALADMTDLRAVVLTGSGGAFSAGGDLIEFGEALAEHPDTLLRDLRYNQDVFQLVEDLPVPVIGAVNGVAVAGGLELLLCCDIILAAEGTKLGDGHARYGVIPAGGATVRLLERLSPTRAAQLFYTASLVDATTLRDWGLVNEVVARERLMERAMEIAREISACSPEAIRHMKALIGPGARSAERAKRLRAELERFAVHVQGSDLAKGLAAFKAKQPIRY